MYICAKSCTNTTPDKIIADVISSFGLAFANMGQN